MSTRNPTHQILNISINELKDENAVLQLSDASGQIVWSELAGKTSQYNRQVDVTDYAQGIYFLKVQSQSINRTYKVIVK